MMGERRRRECCVCIWKRQYGNKGSIDPHRRINSVISILLAGRYLIPAGWGRHIRNPFAGRQPASARANKEESYFLFFVRAPLINPPPPPPQPTKTIPAQILLCMFYSGRRRFVLCAAAAVVNKFIKVTYGVNLLYGGFFGPCLVRVKENERRRRRERRERAKAASQEAARRKFCSPNLHKIISSNVLGMRIMC
jgi:hypothetical protein